MAEKTKKLEMELFQVRVQLERTLSAKFDDILNIQKSASDRIGLRYGLSSSNTAFTSTTVFVPFASNLKIENNEVAGHTQPNCYKWLATQQSDGMIASGNQNQLQSSLTPLGDLLKALIFLSNLNSFYPSPPVQGFNQRKGSSKVWKEKGSK